MSTLKRILTSEINFIILVSMVALFISFYPTIYEGFQSKNLADPRRVFLWGEHNFTYDYNLYLSKILQGQEGRWTVIDKYTSEPHQGSLLQEFYLISGKIGGCLRFSPVLTYQILRVVLGAGLILATYLLIAHFLTDSRQRKIAFAFALFSGSFPKIIHDASGIRWTVFMEWWQEMDVLRRIVYIPHHLAGHILMVVLLLLLLKLQKIEKRSQTLIFLLSMAAGLIDPPSLIMIWGIWGMVIGYKLIRLLFGRLRHKTGEVGDSFQFLSFGIISLAVLITNLYIYKTTSVYPWKSLVDFNIIDHPYFEFKEYILSIGATFFLGLAGALVILKKRVSNYYPLIFWVLVSFGGIILFQIIPYQSETRFAQVGINIPLAILSVYFLSEVFKKRYWLVAVGALVVSLPAIYISLFGQILFINQRVAAFMPLVPYPPQVMYPLKGWWEAIEWLKVNTNNNAVVLADTTAGNYIPAYSGNTVYIGHGIETVNANQKKILVDKFFGNKMEEKEAKDFLKTANITYVFWGLQEAALGDYKPLKYSFLKVVYLGDIVRIYNW